MPKYFWDNPFKPKLGLNADIERHRKEEQKLVNQIEELEGKTDAMSLTCIRTYRHLLYLLLLSKAEVVSKIGKTKG